MWLLMPLGILVLLGAAVDLIWTALGTHGGGPISAPMTRTIWKGMLAAHRRWPHHRALSFGGSIILADLLAFWVALVWLGWVLVFSSSRASIVDSKNGTRADLVTRIYAVGSQMFTSGTAEYNANGPGWHIANAFVAGSGLIVITMSITYILAVLSAAVQKRTLGSFIWDMGGTPARIIGRAWDGRKFSDLHNHLVEIDTSLELFAEQHLAYPILQYFHSENRRTAAPLRIAALYETLLLIRFGVQEHVRPPQLLLDTSMDAVRGMAEVIAGEYVDPADHAPDRPDLAILSANGIPSVPLEEFEARVDCVAEVRKRLLGMVAEAGWAWADVFNMNFKP